MLAVDQMTAVTLLPGKWYKVFGETISLSFVQLTLQILNDCSCLPEVGYTNEKLEMKPSMVEDL